MREILELFFGEVGAILTQFLIALIGVLILVSAIYWLIKWIAGDSVGAKGHRRSPRLAIIDALPIDSRRKIILFRRDNVEHLVLVGGSSDLVIETPIIRNAQPGGRPRQAQRTQPQHDTEPPARQDTAGTRPLHPIEQRDMASQPQPPTTGTSEPVPFSQDAQPSPLAEFSETTEAPAHQDEADVSAVAPLTLAGDETGSPRAPSISEPATLSPNTQQPQTADLDETEASSPDHDMALKAEATPQTVPGDVAVSPAASPVMADAGNEFSAPGSAHFEEPTKPTAVKTMFSQLNTVSEPATEPNSISDADDPSSQQPESAGAIDEVPPPVADDIDDERDGAVNIAARLQPTVAIDELATASESSETIDTENAAKVKNLEQEMALLLNKITPKRES